MERELDYKEMPSAYFIAYKMNRLSSRILQDFEKLKAYSKLLEQGSKVGTDNEIWQLIDEPSEYYLDNHNKHHKLEGQSSHKCPA